jgi:asparagine N-glycosylation enzyme membrane subunit Stt3
MAVGCALALFVPAVREFASPGLAFLAKSDTWAARNLEQSALFDWKRGFPAAANGGVFGWWSYGIPLAPFVFLAARPLGLPVRAFLAIWTGCLGALTISQVRFASDFAPIACVAIAVSLDQFRVRLATRVPNALAWLSCVALGLVLSWSPIYGNLSSQIKLIGRYRNAPDGVDPALFLGTTTMVRFAESVRAHTPETSGYLDPNSRPEYGILVKPSFGHVFNYVARRATPASGFGPYLDQEKYEATLRFYAARSGAEALSIFDSLGTRYVVTRAAAHRQKGLFVQFLHQRDGSSPDGMRHTREFRLVVEGPAGGTPLPTSFLQGRGRVVPYKLFERVAGAVLELRASPGTVLFAELELETNIGRHFVYRARTTADAAGVARLRVPYATDTEGPTRALAPYRVEVGEGATRSVDVRESEVRAGATIELAP